MAIEPRPKDMTLEQLVACPKRDQFKLSSEGVRDDDFLGFWYDDEAQEWCRESWLY